jgi:hypothetical protein
MLLPSQTKPLAPATWAIGRRGEAPDMHPCVVLDLTTIAVQRPDGTQAIEPAANIAVQLTARPENGGHTYLSYPRRGAVATRFLWPRPLQRNVDPETGEITIGIPGLDDFESVEELQLQLMAENTEFLATATPATTSLDELAAAIVGTTPTEPSEGDEPKDEPKTDAKAAKKAVDVMAAA